MRALLTFVTLIAAFAVNCSPIAEEVDFQKERVLYNRFIDFPDGEGNVVTADLHAEIDYKLVEDIARNPANTEYWLYTRRNPTNAQILTFNDVNSVLNSNFDPTKQTVFLVHGWLSTANSSPNPTSRAAYLAKLDVNVISVDWRRLAMSVYTTAAYGVPAVGEGVGQFVNWLVTRFGVRYDNVHLIGFSLGAHLVGNAGRATGSRVARVTGLDPAGPLWNYNRNRLSPTDGVYVEAIHTDGGYSVGGLGIGTAIAQVDFFPNGGISQPGCLSNTCNHDRATTLFAATVTYNHLLGNRCATDLQLTWNTCRGVLLHMGNDILTKTGVSGSYRVNTAARYPF